MGAVRDVSERDLSRLAKGIMALLEDPTYDKIHQAMAALQSMDDLGVELNRAAIALMNRLEARYKAKKAGHT